MHRVESYREAGVPRVTDERARLLLERAANVLSRISAMPYGEWKAVDQLKADIEEALR